MEATEQNAQQAPAPATPRDLPPNLDAYVVEHIDEAIEKGWIRTYYQPVVRALTGKLCGMEALARWNDPVYGLLPPYAFIGPLEQAQLVDKLDLCIIRQTCALLRHLIADGKRVVPVSVNLSRLDFELCDMFTAIERAVHQNEVPRRLLHIEITESVFGAAHDFIKPIIQKFRNSGYEVWMDDFGSAYSSLNVLKDFDFDVLKIDMGFLTHLDEKSRAIVASVVDMTKRLSIQTLAEGVETPDQQEFLRHIGCEKLQGYLFGKPEPYSEEGTNLLVERLGIELSNERRYYGTIGGVNTLHLSEDDFLEQSSPGEHTDYVSSMPLAFVEFDEGRFHVLGCNANFRKSLQSVGIPNIDAAEFLINDQSRMPAWTARRLIETIDEKRFARQDYLSGGRSVVMRARHVATLGSRKTVLVTIDSAERVRERVRHDRRQEALETMYSIYEHIDVLDMDRDRIYAVYSQAAFTTLYESPSIAHAVQSFARENIYPSDLQRFCEFMDPATLADRVDEHRQGYIVGFFRMRDLGGNFSWKIFAAIRMEGTPRNRILLCIRDTNWENDELFHVAFDDVHAEPAPTPNGVSGPHAGEHISEASLWDSLLKLPGFHVFWKDADRRFVGCNQSFLDFYGFSSQDEIVGKNDEDMGWHVNPVPYMNDELRVLNEGASTCNEPGQCIVRGQLHDIVASKQPVYDNGRIVGLVGCFFDASGPTPQSQAVARTPHIDKVTDMLTYTGLESAVMRYIEAYQRSGTDFSMLILEIERFRRMNILFGYEFGDKVLRAVADTIRNIAGTSCVTGRIFADRFVVLLQGMSDSEVDALAQRIIAGFEAISQVDGTPCTIFASFLRVRYSEAGSARELRRIANLSSEDVRSWNA